MKITVAPQLLSGEVAAPASKSYAHRWLIAAYLAGVPCRIVGAGDSQDVMATLCALQAMGLSARSLRKGIRIEGRTLPREATVYCRESGSTLRFLLPIAAALGIRATFTGEEGLLKRPIEGLRQALNAHGADIEGLTVRGKLQAGDYVVDASVSSQYVTGLLFALPLLEGDSRIRYKDGRVVSRDYVNLTIAVLERAGIAVRPTEDGFAIAGNQHYSLPHTLSVEGDWSAAAFMLAAGAIGGNVRVSNLNARSLQGDMRILPILQRFGAQISVNARGVGVQGGRLVGTIVDIDPVPDLAQIVAVVAAYAEGTTILRNIGRLRLKESDRERAILDMLRTAGIQANTVGDDLYIEGGAPRGGDFGAGNDHRTAMSAAILATAAAGASTIDEPQVVAKSYPAFWQDFEALGGMIDGDI